MVTGKVVVATRSSRLALTQTEEALAQVRAVCPETDFEVRPFTSPGDRDLSTPLAESSVPDDFFTRDLDEAIASGEAQLAIHSAKDLPIQLPDACFVAAYLPARDIRDALVFRQTLAAGEIPKVIATSSPARDQHIRRLYPDAVTKSIRGTIEQRLAQVDAGDYDAVIVAACALERLGLADRISLYLPYDPAPQQGRLALVVHRDNHDLRNALAPLDVRQTSGLVAIVGCPADAALLSARARSYLDHADVVIHDRLLPEEIIQSIQHKAIIVGKKGGDASTPQSEIHRLMLEEAEKGHLVVRLQGGDPLIFAHLSEQLDFLRNWNLRVDLVPALTAAQVAAAHALSPLTHRHDGGHLHLVTGHTPTGEEPAQFPAPGTGNVAIYMGVSEAGDIQARLQRAGWSNDTSILVGERLGYPDEAVRSVPLGALGAATIQRPAVFLLGTQLFPASERTLFVGTDPEHFLRHGPLIHFPLIELVAVPLDERVKMMEQHLDQIDGILFPSRFAVHAVMEAVLAHGDVRALAGKHLLAVGPATATELQGYGLRADASVDHYGGLHALLSETTPLQGRSYLYPCSSKAPQATRMQRLEEAGLRAEPVVFYQNRATPVRPLPATPFTRVLFTSASTVEAYFSRYPDERTAQRSWLAVGPSTAKALAAEGLVAEQLIAPRKHT